jgi:hypothetical protein
MSQITKAGKDVSIVVEWLTWADEDYLAARQLLLRDLLVNGGVLSNTAIEKYLKAIFLLGGLKIPKGVQGHNVPLLYQRLMSNGITLSLNPDYLALLFKLYRLRYPDDLPVGFSVAIDRTRLLTELDRSVREIREGFKLVGPFGLIQTTLDLLKARNDPRLLERNCYLGNFDRGALFKEEAARFAMRVFGSYDFFRAEYKTAGVPDTPNFSQDLKVTRTGAKMEGKLPLD